MRYTNIDLQARLHALGVDPGKIDGLRGPKTEGAARDAMLEHGVRTERGLFGPDGLHRVHWHWSGGSDGVNEVEEDSYNGLVTREGYRVDGTWRPEAQARYSYPKIGASHTWRANTGCVGLCADAMAGAHERPFRWGSAPLTQSQIEEMCRWTAEWCWEFWIPVHKCSTLSHAEIQPTLGIRQRNKWDFMVLPGMSETDDPVKIGDRLRAMTAEMLVDVKAAA